MTELNKPLSRRTGTTRYEKSKRRAIIISLEPVATIGVRLAETRQTYRVDAEVLYEFAVKQHEAQVEKRAGQIQKTGIRLGSARKQARKELAGDLK